MVRLALLSIAALAVSTPALAIGRFADIEVIDGSNGRVLPLYHHSGHYYVAGEPGQEYRVRIANHEPGRMLAVASVDGINVISGETASPDQTGYILDAYEGYDILGWRKSLDHVASFYFTRLPDSYAARTGRAQDVGVIGVALFREKAAPPAIGMIEDRAAGMPAQPPTAAAPPTAPATQAALARDAASAMEKAENRLGTGHGRSQDSSVVNADFDRASTTPGEIVAIYYDSRSNLVARGIIPGPDGNHRPNPFPNGFVPDP